MWVYVSKWCGYVHIRAGIYRGQKRMSDPLGLEWSAVVSLPMWILETELRSLLITAGFASSVPYQELPKLIFLFLVISEHKNEFITIIMPSEKCLLQNFENKHNFKDCTKYKKSNNTHLENIVPYKHNVTSKTILSNFFANDSPWKIKYFTILSNNVACL